MNRAPRLAFLAAFVAALLVWAAPTPRGTVSVVSNTTVAFHSAAEGTSMVMQCPGGAVWYRGFTAAQLATQDAGPQADGGAFGVRADFTSQTDPIGVVMGSGQTTLGLLGDSTTTDGGTLKCYLSTP